MGKKMLRSFVSHSIAAVFVGAAAMLPMAALAGDAIWKGGAIGLLNEPDNWDGGTIGADVLNFPCDCVVTQKEDVAVFCPFGSKGTLTAYKNRNIVFDMGGHALWATRVYSGNHNIQGNFGTTFTFTNGTFHTAAKDDYATTNNLRTAGNTTDMKVIAIGENTTMAVGSFDFGAKTDLYIRNGAKSYGKDYIIRESDNKFLFDGGALVYGAKFIISAQVGSTNNTMLIRSGATATATTDILLGGLSIGDGANNYKAYGAKGRVEVVGTGTSLTCGRELVIRNGTDDVANAHELFVGDGATVSAGFSNNNGGMRLIGLGNKIVVSNGTLTVKNLWINGSAYNYPATSTYYPATNSTFHIVGANANVTVNSLKGITSGDNTKILGAPIFEFVIPEGGWSSAPFVVKEAFTISDDTRIRIDEDSARAYAKQGGGMVPLFSTDSTSKAIAADLAKLSIGLPKNCSLTNESGVLSVKITKPGLVLFVR